MQSEEPHIYNYKFNKGWGIVYSFSTKNDVEYDVRFKPGADYVLPGEYWRDDFYELVIEVITAPNPTHIPADGAIFPTIVAIISDFFAVHERVILYICDDSDSRELARKRKFDNWFNRISNHPFEKYDLPLVVDGPEQYFASLFFRYDNPFRHDIIRAFDELANGEK